MEIACLVRSKPGLEIVLNYWPLWLSTSSMVRVSVPIPVIWVVALPFHIISFYFFLLPPIHSPDGRTFINFLSFSYRYILRILHCRLLCESWIIASTAGSRSGGSQGGDGERGGHRGCTGEAGRQLQQVAVPSEKMWENSKVMVQISADVQQFSIHEIGSRWVS